MSNKPIYFILPNIDDVSDIQIYGQCDQFENKLGEFVRKNKINTSVGSFGEIWTVCYKKSNLNLEEHAECPYVGKYIKLPSVSSLQAFKIEVAIAKLAFEHDFGPRVLSHFICGKTRYGGLIMDRWAPKPACDLDLLPSDYTTIFKKINEMHSIGIFHQDLFLKNILYIKKNIKKGTSKYSFSITDYGLSIPFGKPLPGILRALDYVVFIYGMWHPTSQAIVNGVRPNNDSGSREKLIQNLVTYLLIFNPICTQNEWEYAISMRISKDFKINKTYNLRLPISPNPNIDEMYEIIIKLFPSDQIRKFAQVFPEYSIFRLYADESQKKAIMDLL
jgi:serine/threonine protein kinase